MLMCLKDTHSKAQQGQGVTAFLEQVRACRSRRAFAPRHRGRSAGARAMAAVVAGPPPPSSAAVSPSPPAADAMLATDALDCTVLSDRRCSMLGLTSRRASGVGRWSLPGDGCVPLRLPAAVVVAVWVLSKEQ